MSSWRANRGVRAGAYSLRNPEQVLVHLSDTDVLRLPANRNAFNDGYYGNVDF